MQEIGQHDNFQGYDYGQGAGYGRRNHIQFYGYTDGITGDWPEGLKSKIIEALQEAGYLDYQGYQEIPNPFEQHTSAFVDDIQYIDTGKYKMEYDRILVD